MSVVSTMSDSLVDDGTENGEEHGSDEAKGSATYGEHEAEYERGRPVHSTLLIAHCDKDDDGPDDEADGADEECCVNHG